MRDVDTIGLRAGFVVKSSRAKTALQSYMEVWGEEDHRVSALVALLGEEDESIDRLAALLGGNVHPEGSAADVNENPRPAHNAAADDVTQGGSAAGVMEHPRPADSAAAAKEGGEPTG